MTDKQRIERLEQVVAKLCEIIIEDNIDYSWQKAFDLPKKFIEEIDTDKEEEPEDEE